MRACLVALTLALALASTRASAQSLAPTSVPLPPAPALVDPQPEVALWYRNFVAARANPLGLFELFDLSLRVRLYESDSDALKQNYVGIGTTVGLSPAFGRIGVLAEVQPLTLLRLWASYELVGYFSSFGLMASYRTATADFSDTAIREGGDRGTPGYATYGGALTLGAAFQARLGPVAVRNTFRAFWSSMTVRAGDRVYFDQTLDLQMPNDGWAVMNETDIAWVSDFGLLIAARYTVATPLNEDSHFLPLEDRGAGENLIHRLGPVIAYTFERNPGSRFDAPTLILLAQWHLLHRFRTGRDVDTGLPYIALAFQFTGDLLSAR